MTPEAVAAAFRTACLAELAALKPGNVHRHADGHGMTLADFEASAEVAAPAIARPGARPGARILEAVRRTRAAVGCNTNLGILLLAGPLAQAALDAPPGEAPGSLRSGLLRVLEALDVTDAEAAFAAIRLAEPAGLGDSPAHDVRAPALAGLREAMAAAAGRDSIARQYANGFAEIFDIGLPCLRGARARWGETVAAAEWATTAVYLRFLARLPDSHVRRKQGAAAAEALRARLLPLERRFAAAAEPAGFEAELLALDAALKAERLNPGTSADLTVATLFASALAGPESAAPAGDLR